MTRLAPRNAEAPNRASKPVDWLHWTTVLVVFSITGTISMLFSRFLLGDVLRLDGNIWSGPWSYRIYYLLLITPLYSVTLVAVGTLLGKHSYFKKRVLRMWGRLLPRRVRRSMAALKLKVGAAAFDTTKAR